MEPENASMATGEKDNEYDGDELENFHLFLSMKMWRFQTAKMALIVARKRHRVSWARKYALGTQITMPNAKVQVAKAARLRRRLGIGGG